MVLALDHAGDHLDPGSYIQKTETVKKGIAFFDFDGTITTHDTLLEFIRFTKGLPRFALGFLLLAPWLVAFKLKLLNNQSAKEKMLGHFFKGLSESEFREFCRNFAAARLPGLIRKGAMAEIRKHQAEGYVVVVVSASPENWIADWAKGLGVELIASRLEITEGRLTGRIAGKNCHGPEKVRRILEKYSLDQFEVIYAYGDTPGDRQMMELATDSYYRPFRG